jgi:hypothetical protein
MTDFIPPQNHSIIGSKLFKWAVLLALILFIISVFIFWFGGPSFVESGVQLSIEGPTQAAVGDEITYKIKYTNLTKSDLSNVRFSFAYPDKSVVIKDGKPSDVTKEEFTLDTLATNQPGEKEFKAFVSGNRGDIKTAKVTMSYQASGLKSQFEKTASLATTIVSLPVSLTLSAPPNATNGQTVNYILDYRNESANDIPDLRFEFDYPDGFVFVSSTPGADAGSKQLFSIKNLKKNQGSRITVQGTLKGNEGENKPIKVALKRKLGEDFVSYEEASSSTAIVNPLLGVGISLNGSNNYSTYLGDDLVYTVRYSNNSNFNLLGLTMMVTFEGDMFNFSNLDVSGGYYDSSNNTVTWDSSVVSDFASLAPGKKGELTLRLKVKDQFGSGGTGTKNTLIKASVRLSSPNIPPGVDSEELLATGSLITKISTQPTFTQLAYYGDPAFGSSGPVPPTVGQETTYTVHWSLINPGNNVSDASIVATLPTGVTWKGSSSVTAGLPDLVYNKNSSEISWKIANLPMGAGSQSSKYEAVFQVSVKPISSQKDTVIDLIRNASFSGKDSITGQAIVVRSLTLTTNDTVDHPGEGVVK